MKIESLDHCVLTVKSIDRTIGFYTRVLGMEKIVFGEGRVALKFGVQKINLHLVGDEITPHANQPTSGSADFCLVTDSSIDDIVEHLSLLNVPIELGPVQRTGAVGRITSVYVRDPDQNLVEISTYSSTT